MSKSVNVFSLHPDFLTVFDKMTQEQDKLKCCTRILTCREYWCFYMNMSTTLSVRYRANKQETTSRANIHDNSSRVLEIYMTKLVSGILVLFSEIMVRSRYKANWCAFETEFPHYMSCVEENIFTSSLFPPTLQAAAYWSKMHDKSVCNLTRRTSKNKVRWNLSEAKYIFFVDFLLTNPWGWLKDVGQ